MYNQGEHNMSYPEHLTIKNIRMVNENTCEIYMLNDHKKTMKAWTVQCTQGVVHLFHERLNQLLQSTQPFQSLLQLKQYYKVDVLC